MKTLHIHTRSSLAIAALLLAITAPGLTTVSSAAESDFSKPVIDIGMVVRDSDRTAQFLTNVVGFKEVRGFSVNGDVARKIGLIDGYPADVRVFMLEGAEPATRIKVVSFPKAEAKQADQAFIHSTLGFRYLTLYVKDMTPVLERLKKAAVRTLGETPMEMGTGTWLVAIKDPDGNFIEFVGPRK